MARHFERPRSPGGCPEKCGVEQDQRRGRLPADDANLCAVCTPLAVGLFDENIAEIAALIHEAGGTLYYDGANLNAVMGHSRPGDMGFDIVHVNLHKSFSQPHGGGGPGAGPIAVSERIEPFLPRPQVVRREGDNGGGPPSISTSTDPSRSAACAASRATSASSFAPTPTSSASAPTARRGLRDGGAERQLPEGAAGEGRAAEYLPVAFDRHCMHEFVLSGKPMKRELGLATLDLAKRLLDFGFHPPTVYFPLLVEEALMVEPTETETKESLDAFAEAVEEILAEAERDPDIAKQAPYTTPVRRLDEVRATRRPVVRQPLE